LTRVASQCYKSIRVSPQSKSQVEQLIGDISIAAISSWLKTRNLPHSAGSRVAIVDRLHRFLLENRLSWEELQLGAIELEESSSKRVMLFRLSDEDVNQLQNHRALRERARRRWGSYSEQQMVAPIHPPEPTLVYITVTPEEIRGKFAETHQRLEIDRVRVRLQKISVNKVVVFVASPETQVLQIRFDSPEDIHPHTDTDGNPKDTEYRSFYLNQVRQLLGCSLNAIDLRPILKTLSEESPRPIELVMNKVRTAHNSKMRITNRADVRDDPDWKAAHQVGGSDWAHEEGAGEWLASASSGRLSRNLFTEIDATNGTLRFLADCHEGELNYAISRIAGF
jgi:hypothetical protein